MIENVNAIEFAESIGSVAKSGPINTAEACTDWDDVYRNFCGHASPNGVWDDTT